MEIRKVVTEEKVLVTKAFYKEMNEGHKLPLHKYYGFPQQSQYDWLKNGISVIKFMKIFGAKSIYSENVKLVNIEKTLFFLDAKDIMELTKTKSIRAASMELAKTEPTIYNWIKLGISEKVLIKEIFENDKLDSAKVIEIKEHWKLWKITKRN